MINFANEPNPTLEQLLLMHFKAAQMHTEDPSIQWMDVGVPIHMAILQHVANERRADAAICDEEYTKGGPDAAARAAARIRDRIPHGL